jgi:hypothetical protein
MPRFIIFVRASAESESEVKPDTALLEAMGTYNASLVSASILISADGLLPSKRDRARLTFSRSDPLTV